MSTLTGNQQSNRAEVPQLAKQCHQESKVFQKTGDRQGNSCFLLFNLMMIDEDDEAWETIYEQYKGLARHWLTAKVGQVDPEVLDELIQETFIRLWKCGGKPAKVGKFLNLEGYLGYLRRCAWSVAYNYLQEQSYEPPIAGEPLTNSDDNDSPTLPIDKEAINPEKQAILEEQVVALKQLLKDTLNNERERIVAKEIWGFKYKPAEIYKRHAGVGWFVSADEVSQIKKNILKRLRRNPRLREILGQ